MKELSIKDDNKKPMGTWSKRVQKGDVSEEIRVRQILNGYVINKSKNWKDEKGNYQYDDVEMFSETNPLEEKEKLADDKKIETLYKGLFGGLFEED